MTDIHDNHSDTNSKSYADKENPTQSLSNIYPNPNSTTTPSRSKGKDNNKREVLDPITHLPITIHDITDIELEQIPPPISTQEERKRQKANALEEGGGSGGKSKLESNRRHKGIEKVIQEVTQQGWWNDPGTDSDHTRMQTSIVAGLATGIGSIGGLLLWWFLGLIVGVKSRFGWLDLFLLPIGCLLLSLLVGGAALSFRIFVKNDKSNTSPPSHDHDHSVNGHSDGHNLPENLLPQLEVAQESDAPESALWLNSLLRSVWPIINPALFTSITDIFEDSLQASLPKLVRGVRIADIGQGIEPIRILGIRWLSPGEASTDVEGMKAEEGDFINMELALAYRAKPTTSTGGLKGRSANLHLLTELYVSGGIMVPAWIEITGFLAMARVRIQLTPNPPFLALMTLTLLGQPKVTFNCTPLAKNFLNVMDIPILSNWIQENIDLVMKEYVAPKSINLDLKELLMGVPSKDVEALGVVIVTIRCASGFVNGGGTKLLKLGEDGKKGNLYVTLSWSKWGKFMWATRIISKDSNPVWEETTAVLVTPEEINAQESLRLQMWEADKFTADDLVGTVDVPLSQLMNSSETKNRISIREDQLLRISSSPSTPSSSNNNNNKSYPVPGQLLWECGYFDKTSLQQHLEHNKHKSYDEIKANIESEAERKLREAKTREMLDQQQQQEEDGYRMSYQQAEEKVELGTGAGAGEGQGEGETKGDEKEKEKKGKEGGLIGGEVEQQKKEDLKEKGDAIIANSKPTIEFPSGILGIRIEQISGLGVQNVRETGVKEVDEGEDDDADDLPSAYCTVIVNHQRVYKTRTKMKSNNPFFNAYTERFIRNWQDTSVIIAVNDNRLHEKSPILGVVVLPLNEVFHNRSEFNHSLPIVGGIGYGRIRFSLLFRSVQAKLPRRLIGWDVGTLEIQPKIYVIGDRALNGSANTDSGESFPNDLTSCRLVLRTRYGKGKMVPYNPSHHFHHHSHSQSTHYNNNDHSYSTQSISSSMAAAAEVSQAEWRTKKDRPIRLPVLRRYASCLRIQFRKHALGPDLTPADCVLWLKDIPDEKEVTIKLPIRRQATNTIAGTGLPTNPFSNKDKDVDNGGSDAKKDTLKEELEEGSIGAGASGGDIIPGVVLVVRLRFWHGLSGYHQSLANNDKNLADVMDVLDSAEEQMDVSHELLNEDHSDESDGESDDDEGDVQNDKTMGTTSGLDNDQEKKRKRHDEGVKQQFVDDSNTRRKRPNELHRKHRGLMQWKGMRNVAWVGHNLEGKVEKLGHKIKSGFKHEDREAGLDTEV